MDSNNSTLTSDQLEHRLAGSDAQTCVVASHSPSVHVYYSLRSQIERSSSTWLQEFVSLGGLDNLLDSMCQMTGKSFTSFSDAILQIDCISCIRAILNTPLGIDHLLHSSDDTNKLVIGLNISNTLPKKQILEMAAAVCAHSALGYKRILEGLDHLKRKTNQYHRFSMIVNELKSAETVPHKTAVMTFINTLINCNLDLNQRCRVRNQMIGLTLLDVISFLQREETDDDLHIQIQTFHDCKHQDEEMLRGRAEVDLSSPTDLADALQSRVFGTGRMVSLVNILQDLLAIEVLDKQEKEQLWGVVEQQVHHLVHASRHSPSTLSNLTPRQVDDLLYSETQMTQSLVSQATVNMNILSPSDNDRSMYDNLDDGRDDNAAAKKRLKTSEPDLLGDLNDLNIPPTPATTKNLELPNLNLKPPRPSLPLFPVTVSSYSNVTARRGSLEGRSYRGSKHKLFRMSTVPFPGRLMRNLKWIKVSDTVVESNKGCVWEPREVIPRLEPDYCRLEQMFAETHVPDANDEIPLLASETRLRINLFLNRLEVEPDELVRNLIDSEASGLTLPLLKYLHDILPCHEEGWRSRFLLHLMDIPDYRTLLLGHLTRLEFAANISRLQRALKAMVGGLQVRPGQQGPVDLLQLVVRVGNFLNHIVAVMEDTDERMFKLLTEVSKLDEGSQDVKKDFVEMQHSISELRKPVQRGGAENTLFKRQRTQARRRSDQFKAKLKTKRLALEFGKRRASSSMLEERKRVLERILGELHRGNFRPIVTSELNTPEQEEEVTLGSETPQQQTTPVQQPIETVAAVTSKLAATARAVSSPERYKRPLELTNDLLEDPPPALPPKLQHPQVTQLQQSPTGRSSHPGQHHRSRSDLTDSICLPNKWLRYEEMKMRERESKNTEGAPLAVPESSLTLATLNLEDGWGGRKSTEPIMRLNSGPIVRVPHVTGASSKIRKSEKKTAIGNFISKISRAVLKPRNSTNVERNILRPSQTHDKGKGNKGHLEVVMENKENVASGFDEARLPSMKRNTKVRGQKVVV
ncbi:hypothetical protein BaRGS_00033436 [Batillaria attramentaria]|uniref:GBD/FH3 domain-containing protein n=1 Tax=Batillaria attramentaria TaxID=370345 RepID=A0ABD0JK95_9CAEN